MAATTKIRTMVVLGSTRNGPTPWGGAHRLGERVGKFLEAELKKRSGAVTHEIDFVDLIDAKIPLMENPYHYYPAGTAPKELEAWNERVAAADSYIFISPEYSHSMSPALANFLNHFSPKSYTLKPSLIAVYSAGPFGGMRAAMGMRVFLGELSTVTIPAIFSAPSAQGSLDENGVPQGPNGELLKQQATNCFTQLEWMAVATKKQREAAGMP